jgi:hypothetical protein
MGESQLNILFVNADSSDYLGISLLHGLRQLENINVVDYPKSDISYKKNSQDLRPYLRGNGFTLYFTLDDVPIKRLNIKSDQIIERNYDLIIFNDIKSNFGFYFEYLPYLAQNKTAVLDGSDDPCLFGNHGEFWRKPYYWFIPKPQNKFLYFKREWIDESINYSRFFKLLPKFVYKLLPQKKNLRKISFSIPENKIVLNPPTKIKLFPKHIVDDEVRIKYANDSYSAYAFETEDEYYSDLQSSKFGITTKRAGWDCLRHYEIAANGSVICFRDLDKKPVNCAPHGLIPNVNCISYSNYNDLIAKTQNLTDQQYALLLDESLKWIRSKTTKQLAIDFLSHFF